jgi:AraC-like DNA-binding protein
MKSARQPILAGGVPLAGQVPCHVPLLEAKSHAFLVTRYRERAFHFVWHFHTEIELVWIRRGGGLRYVGADVETFAAGDLVLLGSGLPHAWASTSDWRGACVWTVIHLQPELWGPAFWHLPELQNLQALFTEAERGAQFLGPPRWEVGRRIEALARRPPYTLEATVELLDIFRRLLGLPRRLLNPSPANAAAGMDARLVEVLALIRQRACEPLSQAHCARATRMSPPAFSRWFKAQTGRTFQCYLNELRVANVCACLAAGKANTTQAAFACGYSNLANFYRRFRQVTGLSPREFGRLTRHAREQRVRELIIRHGLHSAVRVARIETTQPQAATGKRDASGRRSPN